MKKNYLLLIIILTLLAVNACSKAPNTATTPVSESTKQTTEPSSNNQVVQDNSGKTVLYWYDPMVADKKFNKPGKSPFMDMQLVPKYKEDAKTVENKKDDGQP